MTPTEGQPHVTAVPCRSTVTRVKRLHTGQVSEVDDIRGAGVGDDIGAISIVSREGQGTLYESGPSIQNPCLQDGQVYL